MKDGLYECSRIRIVTPSDYTGDPFVMFINWDLKTVEVRLPTPEGQECILAGSAEPPS